ncbi:MAG: radical SAM protein [Candidatus Omnitrophica bacterium]|nr:radical SAM protein [Candidatus Omnitrophota bacterium]MBU4478963.1 radical SAM protein [Candidatus Omnitrophota bacterium]MCG2703764.1 radical SAM protein [Candidatus Omnitrophota bacterium]
MQEPALLVADKNNKIYDMPGFAACGMAGNDLYVLKEEDLVPLPECARLFFLPDRQPIGFDIRQNRFLEMEGFYPCAAFVAPGYTQLFTAAYREKPKAGILPLFSYAPLAWYKGRLHVPALRIDSRRVHDARFMDMAKVEKKIQSFKATQNRLIIHLRNCALNYCCPNAINFFLARYECPLPVSPFCNARCIGCISYQPEGSCASSQHRISFVPEPEEVAEVALTHLRQVRGGIVSFGQGCEGEPLLAADTILKAIKIIRKQTQKGTIHMNTNASLALAMKELCLAGLDSIRVSFNSLRKEYYTRYYQPSGYKFDDVIESILCARKYKKFVSINYLVMPGFTDDAQEYEHLVRFIRGTKVDMIQWRNLNFDPQLYFRELGIKPQEKRQLLGVKAVICGLKKMFPKLRHGYFNVAITKKSPANK